MRPGVLEVLARPFCPVKAFIILDFPTLERPAKATSGMSVNGSCSNFATPRTKLHGCLKKFSASSLN